MPKATLASRAVKNADTGLDLLVTSYKEIKGVVTNTVYYQVVLVSDLGCFKSPSHKESDVVQFTMEKKMHEFEQLRSKVQEMYPETALPPINKKSMIVNDAVLKERRNSLNALLKFFASTSDLAICHPVLEFLGVDRLRAIRFSRGEPLDEQKATKDERMGGEAEDPEGDISEVNFLDGETDSSQKDDNLFDFSEEAEDDDLFSSKGQVQMFAEQDLKRDLTEEDEKDFSFIPDAIITKKVTVVGGEEDHSDLFQIEDDLDELLKIDKTKNKTQSTASEDLHLFDSPKTSETTTSKPSVPSKPNIPSKPTIPSKPKIAAKPQTGQEKDKQPTETTSHVNESLSSLGQDDILKYLQDNANDEEVDLFS